MISLSFGIAIPISVSFDISRTEIVKISGVFHLACLARSEMLPSILQTLGQGDIFAESIPWVID